MKTLMSLSVLLVVFFFAGKAYAACSQSQLNNGCYNERECSSADNPHHERCRTVCLSPAGSENYYCSTKIHRPKLYIQSDEETQFEIERFLEQKTGLRCCWDSGSACCGSTCCRR